MLITKPWAKIIVFTLLCSLAATALIMVYNTTQHKIQANLQQAMRHQIKVLLANINYDNDLLHNTVKIDGTTVYRAYHHNQPQAAVFGTTSHAGYNGKIVLLVAISPAGKVIEIRVIEHNETPGLGDKMELKNSSWILSLRNATLNNNWDVKKHGGDFDSWSGATITPRAIVKQTEQALIFFKQHKDEIFPNSP